MSIVSFLFSKNGSSLSPHDEAQLSAIDSLFTACINLINREDLISEIVEKYRNLFTKKTLEDIFEYVALYMSLEQFILGNEKPIVKSAYVRKTLREELRNVVVIANLPLEFRLLFENGTTQKITLYELGMRHIIPAVKSNLGRAGLINIVREYTASTVIEQLLDKDGIFHFDHLYKNSSTLDDQKLSFAFARLYSALYDKLAASFGEAIAGKAFESFYVMVKAHYDLDTVSQAIDVLPGRITEVDKLHYLSREELQKQIVKATTDLKAQRDQANAIISSLGEGMLVLDQSLKVQVINPTGALLLGVNSESSLNLEMHMIMPLYQQNASILSSFSPVLNAIQKGQTFKSELKDRYTTRHSNGKMIPIVFTIAPIHNGATITGAVVVFRDVSAMLAYEDAIEEAKKTVEQKVANRTRQLKELQLRLFTFLNKIPLSIIIFDQGKRLYFSNNTAQSLVKPLSDKASKNISEGSDLKTVLSTLSLRNSKTKEIISYMENPVMMAYEGRPFHSRDIEITFGEVGIPVETFVTPILNASGQVDYVIAVVHDITEEKIIERSKDEFFSIASHELRTPLTAIRGNSALIEEYFSEKIQDPQLKEMIHDIHSSTERLIDIVNDFLNTSRLEQGRMKFDIQVFNMCDVIHEVIQEYQKHAQAKGLFLRADDSIALNKEVRLVKADKNKTKEVLINLIGNAFKFTEKGGVTMAARIGPTTATITVSDTGRGITEEGKQLLFRKFQQTGDSLYTRDTTKGTGLGLYISKMLAEGMGGKIRLENSTAGQGSIFSFDLPLAKAS